ncbi:MAG TPA: beta-propeller fold lactonase family protein [Solirubrobacterales bacterium]|jgi:DNA-binding beta-propeller fold protein YncE
MAVAVAALVFAAGAAAATNLTQKPGTIGCVTETSLSGQCEDGAGLVRPSALAISPDGKNVYSVDESWNSVATLARDPADGTLRPIPNASGCLSSVASFYPECTKARELGGASDVAVSPDGKNVYVTAPEDNAVAVLDRDAEDGHLTQSSGDDGCVSSGVAGCGDGRALDEPASLVVSPDGKDVYVGSRGLGGGIAVFHRDPETGDLSQDSGASGCVDESGAECTEGLTEMVGLQTLEISPDGRFLYALSPTRDAVTVYEIDGDGSLTPLEGPDGCVVGAAADGCTVAIGIGEPRAIAFSSGGENAYLASERRDAILIFDRNVASGALTQKPGTSGCVSNTGMSDPMQAGTLGQCVNGVAMDAVDSIAVLPDGSALYATAGESDGLVVFERAADGTIAQRPGTAGCITETGFEDADLPWTEGTCEDGRALMQADGVVVSEDSRHVYTSARFGGVASFDVVPPPGPEQPAAAPSPSPPGESAVCLGARARARKIANRLKNLARENERKARKATFVTSEAARDRLNESAEHGRKRAKGMRIVLRRANGMVRQLCG